jgi:hypothetical protein
VQPLPPLFSFVSTSRNDDHGGDVLRRTQSYVNRLAEQAARHRIRCELVLVEWNPPGARAPLADVLDWPEGTPWFSARVITVSRETHRSLRHSIPLQMFQMIAKNVGIRRAAGDYVIATNIDIVFSDELFEFLKTADLEDDVLYRSDRWDIPNALQLEPSLDTLLARARQEAIRKNLRDGTHVRQQDGEFRNTSPARLDDYFVYPVRNQIDRLLNQHLEDVEALRKDLIWLRDEFIEQQRRFASAPLLHTNGCGDFTMLSRHGWGRLRGYPEWHLFSWAIDSVLIYQAHYNGLRIEELPADAVHYHIEHDHGSGWSPEGAASLWERIGRVAIPYLDMDDFKRLVLEMQDNAAQGLQTTYCSLEWGFAAQGMPDELVAAPNQPARPAQSRNEAPLVEDPTAEFVARELAMHEAVRESVLRDFELMSGDDGAFHRLSTQGSPWGYALSWTFEDRSSDDDLWLEIKARPQAGAIAVCVLDTGGQQIVAQATFKGPGARERVVLRVPAGAHPGQIVCRNAGCDEAIFDLESIALLEPSAALPAEASAGG